MIRDSSQIFAPSSGDSPVHAQFENLAHEIEEHGQRLFVVAILYGIAMHGLGVTWSFVPGNSVSPSVQAIAIIAEALLIAALYFRRQCSAILRRRPSLLVVMAGVGSAIMIGAAPVTESPFYDIAYIPMVIAAFSGWRDWLLAIAATNASVYWIGVAVAPEGVDMIQAAIDSLEFFVMAGVAYMLSTAYIRQIGQILRMRGRLSTEQPEHELAGLTERQLEIALRVAAGHTNDQIASEMFLSRRTVEGYVASTRKKLGTDTRVGLAVKVALAMRATPATQAASAELGIDPLEGLAESQHLT